MFCYGVRIELLKTDLSFLWKKVIQGSVHFIVKNATAY